MKNRICPINGFIGTGRILVSYPRYPHGDPVVQVQFPDESIVTAGKAHEADLISTWKRENKQAVVTISY